MTVRRKLLSALHRIWPPEPKPLILVYHRIAEVAVDHWGLCVSPSHFEEQLHVMRRTRRPLPLADFVRHLTAGTLPQDAVAVTFDDGYVDNLVAGKPRLAAADVPATVFLATGYLGRPGEFWWDELSRLLLAGRGPRTFELVMRGQAVPIDLGAEPVTRKDRTPTATTARQMALTPIWEAMRRMEVDERDAIMTQLRAILADPGRDADRGRAMTSEEVRALASDGSITIGAHTVTHPLLPDLADAACRREIAESKTACEALIETPVAGFAYPYGGVDAKARDAVSAAGFAFACSTHHAPASSASDPFALPRIQICNWDGDVFQRALHRWSASGRSQ